MNERRFSIGDRLINADHSRVEFGRVIDRSGSEYRTLFPEDGDRDDAHWCDDEDSMRFVHVDDSAIAQRIMAAEQALTEARAETKAAKLAQAEIEAQSERDLAEATVMAAERDAARAEADSHRERANSNFDEAVWAMSERDDARAELAALRERVLSYEDGITWGTTCLSCARILNGSIKDYARAERAEAELAALREAVEDVCIEAEGRATAGRYPPSMAVVRLSAVRAALAAPVEPQPTEPPT